MLETELMSINAQRRHRDMTSKDITTRGPVKPINRFKDRIYLHGVTFLLTLYFGCEKAFAFQAGEHAGKFFNTLNSIVSSQGTPIVLAAGAATSLYYAITQQKLQPVMIGLAGILFYTGAKSWIGNDFGLVM